MLMPLLWMTPSGAEATDSSSAASSCLTVTHIRSIACVTSHRAEVWWHGLCSPDKRLGCQDIITASCKLRCNKYERGQAGVSRAIDMAWLRSSKMVLRGNLGSDTRSHAVIGIACSVPSRGRPCSLFNVCIA